MKSKNNETIIDSRWSWIVLISMFLNCFISTGVCLTYDWNDLNIKLRGFHKLLDKIPATVVLISAPLSHQLIKHVSYMWTQIIGGLLSAMACMITFLTYNPYISFITDGLIIGIGGGLIITSSITVLKFYFGSFYFLANGLLMLSVSLGFLTFPFLKTHLQTFYGHQGAFLIISGIYLNICVTALTLIRLPRIVTFVNSFPITTNKLGAPYPFPKPLIHDPHKYSFLERGYASATQNNNTRDKVKNQDVNLSFKKYKRYDNSTIIQIPEFNKSPLTVDVLFVVLRLKAWKTGLLLITGFLSQFSYQIIINTLSNKVPHLYYYYKHVSWIAIGYLAGHVIIIIWALVEDLHPYINPQLLIPPDNLGNIIYKGVNPNVYIGKIWRRLLKTAVFQSFITLQALLCVPLLYALNSTVWLPILSTIFGAVFGGRQSLLTSVLTSLFGPQQFFAAVSAVLLANGLGALFANLIILYVSKFIYGNNIIFFGAAMLLLLSELSLFSFTFVQIKRHIVQLIKCRSVIIYGALYDM